MTGSNRVDHIRITSHPAPGAKLKFPITWGAPSARERGPVIGTVSRPRDRNVIGTHVQAQDAGRADDVVIGSVFDDNDRNKMGCSAGFSFLNVGGSIIVFGS